MPKVFYVGGGTHSRGMLRAVISTAELVIVTVGVDIRHLGPCFPDGSDGKSGVVVEVCFSEADSSWLKGFYRLGIAPSDFDEKLRSLPQTAPPVPSSPAEAPLAQHPKFFRRLIEGIRSGPPSCD
jgi:hypothetical protein